jgi:hypothetical protein
LRRSSRWRRRSLCQTWCSLTPQVHLSHHIVSLPFTSPFFFCVCRNFVVSQSSLSSTHSLFYGPFMPAHHTLCYVPHSMFHTLCSTLYVPHSMFHTLCSTLYVPHSMFHTHCSTMPAHHAHSRSHAHSSRLSHVLSPRLIATTTPTPRLLATHHSHSPCPLTTDHSPRPPATHQVASRSTKQASALSLNPLAPLLPRHVATHHTPGRL